MYMLRMDWNWHEVGEWDERIYNIVRFKGSDRGTILGRFQGEVFSFLTPSFQPYPLKLNWIYYGGGGGWVDVYVMV